MAIKIFTFAAGLVDGSNLPQPPADESTIETFMTWFFVVAAVVSFLVIVIAGFQMIIASGEPEKIAKARRSIIYALLGLVISLLASVIVGFVIGRLV